MLFFYPLDFTFVCPTEIIAFSDRVEEFRAINCEVVACSVDSQFSHLAWYVRDNFHNLFIYKYVGICISLREIKINIVQESCPMFKWFYEDLAIVNLEIT